MKGGILMSSTWEGQMALEEWQFAQEEARKVIFEYSHTFYFATGLLPSQKKTAVRALYAFCRRTDDIVDIGAAGPLELERWRAKVNLEPAQQVDPVLKLWSAIRSQHGVDRQYERELIDGVAMDLHRRSYKTWEELKGYCYMVASTVGLMSMPLVGLAPGVTFEQARPFAVKLGIALQLTNILRDVGEDARSGRVYLPEEDLHRFQLTPADIIARVYDQRFIALMQYQISRARQIFKEALPGIALLHASVRPAVTAAAVLYRAILDEIEKIDYQVHHLRAHTSAQRKLSMLPGILWQVARMRPPV
jgi:phytoene synthase